MPAGRPTKLTPEISKAIIEALGNAPFIETAITSCRVKKRTFYDWMRKGKKDEEAGKVTDYAAFAWEVEIALANAELVLMEKLKKEQREWKKWAWLLERRFRDRWALRIALENSRE